MEFGYSLLPGILLAASFLDFKSVTQRLLNTKQLLFALLAFFFIASNQEALVMTPSGPNGVTLTNLSATISGGQLLPKTANGFGQGLV